MRGTSLLLRFTNHLHQNDPCRPLPCKAFSDIELRNKAQLRSCASPTPFPYKDVSNPPLSLISLFLFPPPPPPYHRVHRLIANNQYRQHSLIWSRPTPIRSDISAAPPSARQNTKQQQTQPQEWEQEDLHAWLCHWA